MLFASVIYLIKQAPTRNAIGDTIMTETQRMVYADVESIGLKRKMEALQAGLKLEYKFTLSDVAEYDDEECLIYNGIRYNVVSTYVNKYSQVEIITRRF